MFRYDVDSDITLKLLTKQHASHLFGLIESNREFLRECLPWIDRKKSLVDIQTTIEKWGMRYLSDIAINAGIFCKGDLAGMIAFPEIDWQGKKASFGYWLSPNFEGKGIISRSVRSFIEVGFHELGLNRIEISCAESNVKSRALPEKLGFIQEGILRDHYYINGKLHNLVIYSLLKSEWN
jgi:ribosomal-protein-serine acetyltransferase